MASKASPALEISNEIQSPSTGAVICAAGLSSRMRSFKPMLYIGSQSMIRQIVEHFQAAGVSPIVVVTGYKASALKQHLDGTGVLLVHNARYASTHMYDSLLLGAKALEGLCDRFFFTPADIPLFHPHTLKILLDSGPGPAFIPTCQGKSGHPVLIDSACIPYLKQYQGQGGLRGALSGLPIPPERVEVGDEGILFDADNENDYYTMLKKERELSGKGRLRFELGLQMTVTEPFFSASSAQLLELIEQTGSIQTASSCMHISYTTAWKTVNHIEQQLGFAILERTAGGSDGGGSRLTGQGQRFLAAYQVFQSRVQTAGEEIFNELFMAGPPFLSKAAEPDRMSFSEIL